MKKILISVLSILLFLCWLGGNGCKTLALQPDVPADPDEPEEYAVREVYREEDEHVYTAYGRVNLTFTMEGYIYHATTTGSSVVSYNLTNQLSNYTYINNGSGTETVSVSVTDIDTSMNGNKVKVVFKISVNSGLGSSSYTFTYNI